MNTKKAIINIKTRKANAQYIATSLKTLYLISVREKQRCEVMTRLEIILPYIAAKCRLRLRKKIENTKRLKTNDKTEKKQISGPIFHPL